MTNEQAIAQSALVVADLAGKLRGLADQLEREAPVEVDYSTPMRIVDTTRPEDIAVRRELGDGFQSASISIRWATLEDALTSVDRAAAP
jgi:hypothetical protein